MKQIINCKILAEQEKLDTEKGKWLSSQFLLANKLIFFTTACPQNAEKKFNKNKIKRKKVYKNRKKNK